MPGCLQIAWRCLKQSDLMEDRGHLGRPGTSLEVGTRNCCGWK